MSGVILRRLFREGSIVRQGQTLYQIDPSLYQAQVAQASANLQSARASAEAARARASRYRPLAEMEAVSKQDYTDAVAQARQADAAIAQNNAALRTAQINLRYTRVPAPISGRIGLSAFTEGALVTANQADALTTITRLDPVYVDIQQSAPDLLALRRSLTQGGTVPTTAQVRLKLPDGSDYGYTGTVQFTEVVVERRHRIGDASRPLPQSPVACLLPGMFVTASFAQAIDTTAYLVPQAGDCSRSQGQCDAVGRRARQHGGAAHRRRRPDRGPELGRDPGPGGRGKGDHPGRRQLEGRRQDQAGPGQHAAAHPGPPSRPARAGPNAMSRVFIDRPIFAWVIAIIIMLLGLGAINRLPIAQYPDVAPPQVNVRATYPGASAQTLQDSVTQILEQQLTGLDGLLYFQSSSSSRGQVDDQRHLRKRNRPRHRAGAGPECGPGGRLAPSAAGPAAGRPGHQIVERLPADHRRL